jgi:hypothetical protein
VLLLKSAKEKEATKRVNVDIKALLNLNLSKSARPRGQISTLTRFMTMSGKMNTLSFLVVASLKKTCRKGKIKRNR